MDQTDCTALGTGYEPAADEKVKPVYWTRCELEVVRLCCNFDMELEIQKQSVVDTCRPVHRFPAAKRLQGSRRSECWTDAAGGRWELPKLPQRRSSYF